MKPVHVINFEIPDNPEAATIGAFQIHDLCELVRRFTAPPGRLLTGLRVVDGGLRGLG